MNVLKRNNVTVSGHGAQIMMFAHGYGCNQTMWRRVAPAFCDSHRVVLFDHVGCGDSDLGAYDPEKYGSLSGYAADVVEILAEMGARETIFVGHSVGAMIGALAAIAAPDRFARLVLVGPSPCYVNDDGYHGGFEASQIDELLAFLEENPLGWSAHMAPVIVGNRDRPEHAEELRESFCRMDPRIAREFARATFTADNRSDLPRVPVDALVLQCSEDPIAPLEVGRYVHAHLPRSRLVVLKACGHCPNLTAPDELIEEITLYLRDH